jgi:hypothetical protein
MRQKLIAGAVLRQKADIREIGGKPSWQPDRSALEAWWGIDPTAKGCGW